MIPAAIKIILTVSLFANILLAAAAYEYRQDYDALLTWACANGNGGAECGED